MSSNRQLRVITLLIIASLVGIGILFVRKTTSFSCLQSDPEVCRFLENYSNMSKRPMKGLYTVMNQNDESTIVVTWYKEKENSSISASQEDETILDAILLDKYLYLKDYADNKWWKQKVSDTPFTESYLPFDPHRFFIELDPVLFDAQTIYKKIGETKCGEKKCMRYQVTSPKQSKDLQRFVYITQPDNQLYIVVDANSSSSHEIKMAVSTEYIYEPKDTKIPAKDKNIFLDYLTRQGREREKQLEYLKEFQNQREQAEGFQSDGPTYVDPSKAATESAN